MAAKSANSARVRHDDLEYKSRLEKRARLAGGAEGESSTASEGYRGRSEPKPKTKQRKLPSNRRL